MNGFLRTTAEMMKDFASQFGGPSEQAAAATNLTQYQPLFEDGEEWEFDEATGQWVQRQPPAVTPAPAYDASQQPMIDPAANDAAIGSALAAAPSWVRDAYGEQQISQPVSTAERFLQGVQGTAGDIGRGVMGSDAAGYLPFMENIPAEWRGAVGEQAARALVPTTAEELALLAIPAAAGTASAVSRGVPLARAAASNIAQNVLPLPGDFMQRELSGGPGYFAGIPTGGGGLEGEVRKAAGVSPDESASDLAMRMGEMRKTQPRPLNKLYGPNPTPEQVASSAAEHRIWNSEYRKLSSAQKLALERDNAAFAANRGLEPSTTAPLGRFPRFFDLRGAVQRGDDLSTVATSNLNDVLRQVDEGRPLDLTRPERQVIEAELERRAKQPIMGAPAPAPVPAMGTAAPSPMEAPAGAGQPSMGERLPGASVGTGAAVPSPSMGTGDSLPPPPGAPVAGDVPPQLPGPVTKLRDQVDLARPLTTTTKELQSAERSRRVAMSESILTRGGRTPEAYEAARAAQGGPLPRVQFEPLAPNFTPEEITGFRQTITDRIKIKSQAVGHSLYYSEANAVDALDKVLKGQLDELRPSELGLLDDIFGREVTASVVKQLSRTAGMRGGIHWPLAGLDFSDESKAIIRQFEDNFTELGKDIKTRPWRSITSKIGGDIEDPWVSELVNMEEGLYRTVLRTEMDKVTRYATEGMSEADKGWAHADEFIQAQEALNKAREARYIMRRDVLDARRGADGFHDVELTLQRYDLDAEAAHTSLLGKVAAAQQPLKEIMLGLDFGVAFQQGLRGVRMGSTSALTSAMARMGDTMMSAVGKNVDHFGIYPNPAMSHRAAAASDGLILRGSASVGLERDAAREAADKLLGTKLNLKLPFTLARKGVEKLADVQYGVLDKFRLQVYEGRLIQERLLGRDITNPALRRQVANFANTAGSTARTATNPNRALGERALFLSPQLTRSQFAELAQPVKALTSVTEANNFLNQIASTSATFGLAYAIQSQFGPDLSFEDFLKTAASPASKGFGRMALGKGKDSFVFDFLPQFSLERAVLKSINGAAEGNLKAMGDAWVRYGTGRMNVGPSGILSGAGFGYGKEGKFHYGDMPLEQRAIGAAPIPISVQGPLIEGESEAGVIIANALGGNAWGESPTQQRLRDDPELASAIELYYEAYDEGFNLMKETGSKSIYAPLLREADSYDDLRNILDEIATTANELNPQLNKQTIIQAIQEELGITAAVQEIRKSAARRNPALLNHLEERGVEVPKYLWEVVQPVEAR